MPANQTFRRRHRLTHAREFQRVYGNRVRKSEGPLLVSMAPNDLPEHRLGLSVGRRIGGAVVRTKLKRLIRESFRLARTDLPSPDPIFPKDSPIFPKDSPISPKDSPISPKDSPIFPKDSPSSPATHPTCSYDIVVGVRPHDSLTQQDCQAILIRLVEQCHQVCERRARQAERKGTDGTQADFEGNGAGGNGA